MNTSLTSSSSDGEEETFMSISSILATIETSGSLRWLRKNSRHLVPIFCVVGILGNSMALILISTFVLLNVPSYIMRIIQAVAAPSSHLFHFIHFLTYLTYYLHHAVLFYMYIFWSPQMKKQLKPTALQLLECYCFKPVPEFGHRSGSTQEIL
uniref:Uncharacterized protein n=1 Tax=Caenorhabditis japonica TaxID=281687 RepID=A0A8R1ISR6_CAEJA